MEEEWIPKVNEYENRITQLETKLALVNQLQRDINNLDTRLTAVENIPLPNPTGGGLNTEVIEGKNNLEGVLSFSQWKYYDYGWGPSYYSRKVYFDGCYIGDQIRKWWKYIEYRKYDPNNVIYAFIPSEVSQGTLTPQGYTSSIANIKCTKSNGEILDIYLYLKPTQYKNDGQGEIFDALYKMKIVRY